MDDIKTKLREVIRVNARIREKQILIGSIRARMYPSAVRYDSVKVQTSPSDQLLELASLLDEKERELNELISTALPNAIKNVERIISGLDREVDREVFYLWYIEIIKADEIAERLNYTLDGIHKIHRKGLKRLEDNKTV